MSASAASLPVQSDYSAQTQRLVWTLTALAVVLLPHMLRLPMWITGMALISGLWRLLAQLRCWGMPPSILRFGIAVATFFGVLANYGTINGVDAGTALLTVMMAMKLTETRNVRDHVVLLFIGYFLIVANLLAEQTAFAAMWAVPGVWLVSAAMLQTSDTQALPARHALRSSGAMLLQALPIMLVLFVLFPRVPGPFWSLPSKDSAGTTGLSEEMAPGSIGKLMQSRAVAFRVRFEDRIPGRPELYWRGPVLHEFDGRRWSRGSVRAPRSTPELIAGRYTYEVQLEPHEKRWLFALETPDPRTLPDGTSLTWDFQPLASQPVSQLGYYRMRSASVYALNREHRPPDIELQSAPHRNPRTHALARALHARSASPLALVQNALAYFTDEDFGYTLEPPELKSRDPMDEFLFETRLGFCEHFSSAFTVLMRAAGIPARVVTGYLGGEINPLGGHMTVRQSDAHAWSEVWIRERGWVRVDPTGSVQPDRIEFGTGDPAGAELPVFGRGLGQLRFSLDALNMAWNGWVLGYGKDKQLALLERLGMKRPSALKMTVLLMLLLLAIGFGLTLWLGWRSRPQRGDPALRTYLRFCRKLARRGLNRAPEEGPNRFAERAIEARPELAAAIRAITERYVRLRYHPDSARRDQQELTRAVRAFSP